MEFLFKRLKEMEDKDLPDLVVIGLQEVVELKAKNFHQFFNENTKVIFK